MNVRANLKTCLVMAMFLIAMGCPAAEGRTIYVDDDGTAEFDNIQAAIDDSNDGDTIIVKPGLYREYVRFYGKNITLTSSNAGDFDVVASTIIDYGVGFAGSEEPNCQLVGFKINGWIYGGVNHTHATISYCLLSGNRVYQGIVIKRCDGTIKNCVVSDNWPISDHVGSAISDCHGLIKNCTVAHNFSGIFVSGEGTTTIENCIIYENLSGQIGVRGTVNILYSDVQGGVNGLYGGGNVNWGPGNMDTDPCFIDAANGDYHLKSQAGRWDANSQSWVQDANTSVAIDAGDPASPIGFEPFPNGGVINMGAYGGTAEASKSYFGQPVCETIVAGDINGDCKVNFLDFALMALHWLGGERYIPNKPPVVNITNPPDGAVTYYRAIIEIEVDASDDDGEVVKVEFFANESKIGEDNDGTDGWKTNWQDHPIGVYSLTARATDNDDAETTSTPVEITLEEGGGPP